MGMAWMSEEETEHYEHCMVLMTVMMYLFQLNAGLMSPSVLRKVYHWFPFWQKAAVGDPSSATQQPMLLLISHSHQVGWMVLAGGCKLIVLMYLLDLLSSVSFFEGHVQPTNNKLQYVYMLLLWTIVYLLQVPRTTEECTNKYIYT